MTDMKATYLLADFDSLGESIHAINTAINCAGVYFSQVQFTCVSRTTAH